MSYQDLAEVSSTGDQSAGRHQRLWINTVVRLKDALLCDTEERVNVFVCRNNRVICGYVWVMCVYEPPLYVWTISIMSSSDLSIRWATMCSSSWATTAGFTRILRYESQLTYTRHITEKQTETLNGGFSVILISESHENCQKCVWIHFTPVKRWSNYIYILIFIYIPIIYICYI